AVDGAGRLAAGGLARFRGGENKSRITHLRSQLFLCAFFGDDSFDNYPRCGTPMDIMETIKQQIDGNPVILYMKGNPNQPQCGFSARAVEALIGCGKKFAYVDILSNPEIRANLPKYGNWPTFPQLWVKGELIGGCDIVTDMHAKGELLPLIKEAAAG